MMSSCCSPPPLPLCPPASTSYGSCGRGSQPGSWRRPCWLRDHLGGCPWYPPPPGACCNPPADGTKSQQRFTGEHTETDLCFPASWLENWKGPCTAANVTFFIYKEQLPASAAGVSIDEPAQKTKQNKKLLQSTAKSSFDDTSTSSSVPLDACGGRTETFWFVIKCQWNDARAADEWCKHQSRFRITYVPHFACA